MDSDTSSTVYKGSPQLGLDEMSSGKTAAAILLTGLVIGLLSILFWVPYVRAKVIKKDYSKLEFYPAKIRTEVVSRSYPILPLLLRSFPVEPTSAGRRGGNWQGSCC